MKIEEFICNYAGSWTDKTGEINLEIIKDGSIKFNKIEELEPFSHPASHYYGDYYVIEFGSIANKYALKPENGILYLVKFGKPVTTLGLPDEKFIKLRKI